MLAASRSAGVNLSPYPSQIFEEVSEIVYGGPALRRVSEGAEAASLSPPGPVQVTVTESRPGRTAEGEELRVVTFRPLFAGPAVERVPELQFQRPDPRSGSPRDAGQLGVANGQDVTVRSNGTSRTLRARLADDLSEGAVRIAEDYAEGLEPRVEISA